MKIEPPPPILYKLRPLASETDWQRATEILLKRQLWFSSVGSFNDPFEGLVSINVPRKSSAVAAKWAKRVGRYSAQGNRAERRQKIQEVARRTKRGYEVNGPLPSVNDIGVCCLMEMVDSLLAWSHYACGHRGVAFGFRPTNSPDPNIFDFAYRVTYSEEKPVDDIVSGPRAKAFDSALLTKAKCWDYEKEWRLIGDPMVRESIRFAAHPNSSATFPLADLTEIRLGAKLTQGDKKRLFDLVKSSGANPRVYEATLHPTKYQLVFSELASAR